MTPKDTLRRRSNRNRNDTWTPAAWQIQSLLLAYPDDQLLRHTALARRTAAALPPPAGHPLDRFLDHVERTPLTELAADYVATFDHRKRCCPFLTYYAHGDTRKRGVALLRLKQAYAAAGMRLTDDELPDHLAVVLEFAAAGDPAAGAALLQEHRAGVELLRLALTDLGSPWAHVLESVCATLTPLAGDERQAVARLAAEGPPEEQVGLAPYTPPQFMPDPVEGRR
ncbi:nitrate reductase molybdenum cofactor assembly chaperone [Streptomyces sp. ACA25]|uniref:nitrate reductase molybdenum cofactor assembly chaperone n=1 Tax=Streptomyces sp. ACA25 TaxID=3022596 RepID=UPI002307E73A|nr:nitrate reductase molybdenum cofactor assembly chaperone [Streptomyces sp. ACA25]MDB1086769.1 nitrate reductase molybdenum cofactor assembly chaperone [Streptomyces sp. ACA25]